MSSFFLSESFLVVLSLAGKVLCRAVHGCKTHRIGDESDEAKYRQEGDGKRENDIARCSQAK